MLWVQAKKPNRECWKPQWSGKQSNWNSSGGTSRSGVGESEDKGEERERERERDFRNFPKLDFRTQNLGLKKKKIDVVIQLAIDVAWKIIFY